MNRFKELDEFYIQGYESSSLYIENMKKNHDQKIEKRDLVVWNLVCLFNYRLQLFIAQPNFLITQLFPHGAVELKNKEGVRFYMNGQRIKIYIGHAEYAKEVVEAYHLDKV